jgi:hypothetical protein
MLACHSDLEFAACELGLDEIDRERERERGFIDPGDTKNELYYFWLATNMDEKGAFVARHLYTANNWRLSRERGGHKITINGVQLKGMTRRLCCFETVN